MRPYCSSPLTEAWDQYDAYLFDIDGTLVVSEDAVHYFAFCDALKMLSGQVLNLDGVVAHGNTDRGILRDALLLNGIPEEQWRPLLVQGCEVMRDFVRAHKDELRVRALPGVANLLSHLAERGAILGVATGNLEAIGRSKLEAAGLGQFFTCGSYSDQDEFRQDVFRRAVTSVRAQIGDGGRICIIGDTPADIRAARFNGIDIFAVATGVYSIEELRKEHPDMVCSTFLDLPIRK